MTPRALLLSSARRLREKNIPDPAEDASQLLSHLTGREPLSLRLDTETILSEDVLAAYDALLRRREQREPLQYLTGSVSFCSLSFRSDSRALIPRPETALLASWALEELKGVPHPAVLDLCCGTGCLGLTLKKNRPDLLLTLSDLSREALSLARENADLLGVEAAYCQGDLFDPVDGSYDLILCNPPYIPSDECLSLQPEVLWEPRMALDGGTDGLAFYRRLLREASFYLKPGGRLMMEIGQGQGQALRHLANARGGTQMTIRPDFAGIDRMVLVRFSDGDLIFPAEEKPDPAQDGRPYV